MKIGKIQMGWIFIVFLMSVNLVHGQNKDQARRDALKSTIDEFKSNRENGHYGHPDVILVGSSSFRAYKGFEKDYEGLNAINLGFGGSLLSDILYFFDELIVPYDPKQIIVYEGDNDLNAGMTVDEFMADVHAFVRLVNIKKPGTHISFLTPKPSPARRNLTSKYEAANQALYEYAIATDAVDFIDVSQPMYTLDGQIRKEIWTSDSLHMNRAGYEIWGPIIRSYIRE